VRKVANGDLYELYLQQINSFWLNHEIDVSKDIESWSLMSLAQKDYFKRILAFFASSDLIVGDNILRQFLTEPCLPREAELFYGAQMFFENIHSEMYSDFIDAYIPDEEEREILRQSVLNDPVVRTKAEWACKWMDKSTATLPERLVAFACVEGVMFSSAFAAIFWVKQRGQLPNLCHANELISRDEGLHCKFACLLYSKLDKKLPSSRVLQIITESCDVEKMFVRQTLKVPLLGMNADKMCQYVEYISDYLLFELGCEKYFKASNPFPFMDNISMEGKTNFFERRVSEYVRLGRGRYFDQNADF